MRIQQVRRKVVALLPPFIKEPLKKTRDFARAHVTPIAYHGTGRYCPVCEKESSRFASYGAITRDDALCVRCNSLERHRLLWLYINRKTDLFDGKSKQVLHVAPEACLEDKFRRQLGDGYITADLFNPRAMVKMDIMDIRYPEQSFDVIYCSHVLEHVADDRKAISEFHRVLKRDGWAILLVPVVADKTFEDPSIVDPDERVKAYGQEDHVRAYGPDYADRLREGGFKVDVTRVTDMTTPEDATRMGLGPLAGEIYLCRR